jgi:hypothetical protein
MIQAFNCQDATTTKTIYFPQANEIKERPGPDIPLIFWPIKADIFLKSKGISIVFNGIENFSA